MLKLQKLLFGRLSHKLVKLSFNGHKHISFYDSWYFDYDHDKN